MAARRWRENEAEERCHDCGGAIEPKRKAQGRKCCSTCARERAKHEAERRGRRKLKPSATSG